MKLETKIEIVERRLLGRITCLETSFANHVKETEERLKTRSNTAEQEIELLEHNLEQARDQESAARDAHATMCRRCSKLENEMREAVKAGNWARDESTNAKGRLVVAEQHLREAQAQIIDLKSEVEKLKDALKCRTDELAAARANCSDCMRADAERLDNPRTKENRCSIDLDFASKAARIDDAASNLKKYRDQINKKLAEIMKFRKPGKAHEGTPGIDNVKTKPKRAVVKPGWVLPEAPMCSTCGKIRYPKAKKDAYGWTLCWSRWCPTCKKIHLGGKPRMVGIYWPFMSKDVTADDFRELGFWVQEE